MHPLQNKTVLITRPEKQARDLERTLISQGANPIVVSTLAFKSLSEDFKVNACFAHAKKTILLFVSQMAVELAWPKLETNEALMKRATFVAIGPTTAKALAQKGVSHVENTNMPPYSSEQCLALPCFNQASEQGLQVIVAGPHGGRDFLVKTLKKRGMIVYPWYLYSYVCPMGLQSALRRVLNENELDIIVCASEQAVINLVSSTEDQDISRMLQVPLMVVSDRIKKQATKLGFSCVVIATSAKEQDLLVSLETYFTQRRDKG